MDMESQPQNPEFRNNPEIFHLCIPPTKLLHGRWVYLCSNDLDGSFEFPQNKFWFYSKTCLNRRPKLSFQDRLSLIAGQKYCRMLKESILQYF